MRDYSFGNFLHELRTRRGLTQYQLGALVGVSDKAVSKWENGSSKPQSSILFKLSEILGISVDELLSCKYRSSEKKDMKGIFAMKTELWHNAFRALRKRYGECVPIEIINRFSSENAEMQYTDIIVYLDALAALSNEAKKQGEYIRIRGGTGASFVAYLLGATDINPLKPHYYCPNCQSVKFDNSADDGWDLPPLKCGCGTDMIRDGHDIPIETYRQVILRNKNFEITISPSFFESASEILETYFNECRLASFVRKDKSNFIYYVIVPDGIDLPDEKYLPIEEYYETLKYCTSFNFYIYDEFDKYRKLEEATKAKFETVDFLTADVLCAFCNGETDGIPDFRTPFIKDMLLEVKPKSFRDLIQIDGLAHSTGTWVDNAKELIEKGVSAGKVIAYRDDVFNYIQKRMLLNGIADTAGLAFKVMEDTRRGTYEKGGVSEEMRSWFRNIGMDDWFADSISKIKYLFPKPHGVSHVKLAAILMWYKIHHPKEFNDFLL